MRRRQMSTAPLASLAGLSRYFRRSFSFVLAYLILNFRGISPRLYQTHVLKRVSFFGNVAFEIRSTYKDFRYSSNAFFSAGDKSVPYQWPPFPFPISKVLYRNEPSSLSPIPDTSISIVPVRNSFGRRSGRVRRSERVLTDPL